MKNQYIHYGEEIQLMHYESKQFITGKNDYDRNDMIGYNCKLLDIYSTSMIFKIHPKFKTHQFGDRINYQDSVYIQSFTFNAYINFADQADEDSQKNIQLSNLLPLHIWDDNNYCLKKIFLSYEKDCVFEIKLFQKSPSRGQIIQGFDYVVMEHTEL